MRRVRERPRQDDDTAVRAAVQQQHPRLAAAGPGLHDEQGELTAIIMVKQ